MALDKDILGQALYDARNAFNNKTIDELTATYGSAEGARLAMAKADAQAIIDHFTNNAVLHVPGDGLISPAGAVTGESITGTIQ